MVTVGPCLLLVVLTASRSGAGHCSRTRAGAGSPPAAVCAPSSNGTWATSARRSKCALYELSCRWLTELSVRKTEEEKNAEPQPQGDEDGPPSSDGGQEEVNDFTDDDESMSGASEPPELPEPTPPTEKYTGYFERQREVTFLE